ncbi:MAG: hypothetical protein ACRDSH_02470 [Pseudonocardiaceae bacterium]
MAIEKAFGQGQVHSAYEFGVLLCQGVKGEVAEDDVVVLAGGLFGVVVVGGVAGRFAELLALLVGVPAQDRSW